MKKLTLGLIYTAISIQGTSVLLKSGLPILGVVFGAVSVALFMLYKRKVKK